MTHTTTRAANAGLREADRTPSHVEDIRSSAPECKTLAPIASQLAIGQRKPLSWLRPDLPRGLCFRGPAPEQLERLARRWSR